MPSCRHTRAARLSARFLTLDEHTLHERERAASPIRQMAGAAAASTPTGRALPTQIAISPAPRRRCRNVLSSGAAGGHTAGTAPAPALALAHLTGSTNRPTAVRRPHRSPCPRGPGVRGAFCLLRARLLVVARCLAVSPDPARSMYDFAADTAVHHASCTTHRVRDLHRDSNSNSCARGGWGLDRRKEGDKGRA